MSCFLVYVFKQKTAYEMRISDWSSDVCSSDLPPREVAGASAAQLAALQRLGLISDQPVLRQSQRHDRYQAALDQLLASGQAFACHCSRRDLAAVGGVHRGCRATRKRPTPAIRLRVGDADVITVHDAIQGEYRQSLVQTTGDFVLRRAEDRKSTRL